MNKQQRRAAAAKAQEEAKTSGDKKLRGMEIRYEGRTVLMKAYVNTDEPINVVAERLHNAGAGPGQHMTLVAGNEVPREEAVALWESVFPAVVNASKKQN